MDCDNILELLPEYAAGCTSQKQNAVIVRHIASCQQCREELTFWLTVGRVTLAESQTPSMSFREMCGKIPHTETELDRIMRNVSHKTAFELVRYAFRVTAATYRLANQL